MSLNNTTQTVFVSQECHTKKSVEKSSLSEANLVSEPSAIPPAPDDSVNRLCRLTLADENQPAKNSGVLFVTFKVKTLIKYLQLDGIFNISRRNTNKHVEQ